MPTQRLSLTGHLHPGQMRSFLRLPFEMPPAAVRLEANLTYSNRMASDPRAMGGNTLDFGVLDARGARFLTAGFRGWSGSARDTFFITAQDATPGYLPGPLRPGAWNIVLGLYKIAEAGCDYRVRLTITMDPRQMLTRADIPLSVELPPSRSTSHYGSWLRGDLHCHSFHSDGELPPAALIDLAEERGLDFLAITDHNTTGALLDLAQMTNPGLLVVPGQEVTTYLGHCNVWGLTEWVEFRAIKPSELEAVIAYASAKGGLISCNHPKPFGPAWEYEQVQNYHCIEVWNGPWSLGNHASLDFWTRQLAGGRRIPAVGGSDYHRAAASGTAAARALGCPTTWVHVPERPTAPTLLDHVRRGHVTISEGPDGPFLDLRARDPDQYNAFLLCGDAMPRPLNGMLECDLYCRGGQGDDLLLLDQDRTLFHKRIHEPEETSTPLLNVSASRFVRAEIRSQQGAARALTNPIYLLG